MSACKLLWAVKVFINGKTLSLAWFCSRASFLFVEQPFVLQALLLARRTLSSKNQII